MRIRTYLLFILLLISPLLYSSDFRFTHLTMEQGLSSNLAFCMQQDSKGFMWIGTLSGLNKYNGNEVKVYSPATNPGSITSSLIFSLFEDSHKRLWIGTEGGGLNKYLPERDEFISYQHDPYEPFSISSNQVYTIIEDREGFIWIGTDGGGINKMIKEGEFLSFRKSDCPDKGLKSDTIRVLYEISSGSILAGTERGGLSVITRTGRGTAKIRTYLKSSSKFSIPSNTVRSIIEDSDKNIWLGLQNGGIAGFSAEKGKFYPLDLPGFKNQRTVSVRALYEDRNRNLWIGTENQGIYIYSLDNKSWKTVKADNQSRFSLSSNTIRSIYEDRNNLIWIGTRDGGVNLYNPEASKFRTLEIKGKEEDSSAKYQIREIIQDRKGRIWYASDGGGISVLNRRTGETGNYRGTPGRGGLKNDHCYSLAEGPDGLIWAGTDGGGLSVLNPESGKWVYHYSPENKNTINSSTVWDIYHDRGGNIWIGTEGGGLTFHNRKENSFKTYKYDPKDINSLNGNSIRDIIEDSKGRIWVGTWDGGLNLFDRETEKFSRFIFNPESDTTVSDNSVNVIFEDSENKLWIGTTGGGLNLFNERKMTFTVFDSEDGLAGNNVLGITEDKNSNLWITTNNGLNLFNREDSRIYTFSREDGLPGNEFTHKAVCTASDGFVFAGGTEGISYFNPDEIKTGKNHPEIVMTDLSILNRKIGINTLFRGRKILEKSITETEKITLTQNDKLFTFRYSILDFTSPVKNRYFTMLEGYDTEWQSRGGKNYVTFDSLPHGNYTLHVYGKDHIGNETGNRLNLDIKILPYFWQTAYFKIAFFLVLISSVLLIIKQRTMALERHNRELRKFSTHILEIREEERKKIAREVHDELGQLLTALKIDIFRTDDGEEKESMLSLVNMALDSVKSLSTRLRPKALDTLSFSEAVQWQIVDFQRRTNIKCISDIEETETSPDPETSTVIFRIFQEALTNIIRHSGADKVQIKFRTEENNIILKVIDNGKGIPEGELESTSSFGIIGMKERSNMLGAKLSISSNEFGTEVSLEVPLSRNIKKGKKPANKTLYDTLEEK